MLNVSADPYNFTFDVQTTALMIIDMQRDFLEAGGFGETFGYKAAALRTTIAPTRRVLDTGRASGITVIHTREGHRPDLSDLSASKKTRGHRELCIGDRARPRAATASPPRNSTRSYIPKRSTAATGDRRCRPRTLSSSHFENLIWPLPHPP